MAQSIDHSYRRERVFAVLAIVLGLAIVTGALDGLATSLLYLIDPGSVSRPGKAVFVAVVLVPLAVTLAPMMIMLGWRSLRTDKPLLRIRDDGLEVWAAHAWLGAVDWDELRGTHVIRERGKPILVIVPERPAELARRMDLLSRLFFRINGSVIRFGAGWRDPGWLEDARRRMRDAQANRRAVRRRLCAVLRRRSA